MEVVCVQVVPTNGRFKSYFAFWIDLQLNLLISTKDPISTCDVNNELRVYPNKICFVLAASDKCTKWRSSKVRLKSNICRIGFWTTSPFWIFVIQFDVIIGAITWNWLFMETNPRESKSCLTNKDLFQCVFII